MPQLMQNAQLGEKPADHYHCRGQSAGFNTNYTNRLSVPAEAGLLRFHNGCLASARASCILQSWIECIIMTVNGNPWVSFRKGEGRQGAVWEGFEKSSFSWCEPGQLEAISVWARPPGLPGLAMDPAVHEEHSCMLSASPMYPW